MLTLQDAINVSINYSMICKLTGLTKSGYNYNMIKRYAKAKNIDLEQIFLKNKQELAVNGSTYMKLKYGILPEITYDYTI